MRLAPALLLLTLVACSKPPTAPVRSAPVIDVGETPSTSEPTHETCRLEDETGCVQLCQQGDADSCTRLARLRLRDVGDDRRRAGEVLALFQRACGDGSARGCNGVGVMHQRGLAVDKNIPEAMRWYRRACDGGFAGGCYNLGQLHRFGEEIGADLELAGKLYREACGMGDGDGCAALGALHADGSIAGADPERARELFQRACDANVARGCHNLAIVKLRGSALALDESARALLRRACKLGSTESCTMLEGKAALEDE
jgi:TPR repeat protein